MSTPTKPVNITSPRLAPTASPSGSPSLGAPISASPSPRILRAQFAGTPPVPNIPSRATPQGTPRGPGLTLPPEGPTARRVSVGGITLRRPGTPGSGDNLLDELTDEDKARILRRHLVAAEERDRTPAAQEERPTSSSSPTASGQISKRSSSSHIRTQREDSEPFPVPYHAPGADITYVKSIS